MCCVNLIVPQSLHVPKMDQIFKDVEKDLISALRTEEVCWRSHERGNTRLFCREICYQLLSSALSKKVMTIHFH